MERKILSIEDIAQAHFDSASSRFDIEGWVTPEVGKQLRKNRYTLVSSIEAGPNYIYTIEALETKEEAPLLLSTIMAEMPRLHVPMAFDGCPTDKTSTILWDAGYQCHYSTEENITVVFKRHDLCQ